MKIVGLGDGNICNISQADTLLKLVKAVQSWVFLYEARSELDFENPVTTE